MSEVKVEHSNKDLKPYSSHVPGPMIAGRHPAFANEPTVTMIFPKAVMIEHEKYGTLRFEAGTQEVPKSLSTHWYLVKNGVKVYGEALKPATPPETGVEGEEATPATPPREVARKRKKIA